jgi:hypothetical protein
MSAVRHEPDLEAIRERLAYRFPTLHLLPGPDGPIIRGTFFLEHESHEIDRFAVEIALKPIYDGDLPVVFETAGRIPRTPERHVNDGGSACVCLPIDYFRKHPGPFDLMAFLEGPVRDYFLGQALVERGEPWPYGEWRHGGEGAVDWLLEFARSLGPKEMDAYLSVMAIRHLKGHVACPCASGKKIRHCHMELLNKLRSTLTLPRWRRLFETVRLERRASQP